MDGIEDTGVADGREATPNFESIKRVNAHGAEYWKARDLAPLLGYARWQRFAGAINRAGQAMRTNGDIVEDHVAAADYEVISGKGGRRVFPDYDLSRYACYAIAQNGDVRKAEIAAAQQYFIVSTRENEVRHLAEQHEARVELRVRTIENNKKLAEAAVTSGVQSASFGRFQNAGYRGLYGGRGLQEIKAMKGIGRSEDLLDRAGRAELAANDFRITQTEERLRRDGAIGEGRAIEVHHQMGLGVRKAISDLSGVMPESLPPEPSIKAVVAARRKDLKRPQTGTPTPAQYTLPSVAESDDPDR